MGYLCGPLLPHAPLSPVRMHTRDGGKHAGHAAPRATHASTALVCAAAGLEGVDGQDTTTWTAERMGEASAGVVSRDDGSGCGDGCRGREEPAARVRAAQHSLYQQSRAETAQALVTVKTICSSVQPENSPCAALEGEESFHGRRFFSASSLTPRHRVRRCAEDEAAARGSAAIEQRRAVL